MKIKVALDWTPNAVHAGLYLAQFNGWYKEAGLDVQLISPEKDQYEVPPIEKLFRKQVAFAIAPSEMVIRSHQYGYKELVALAALLQGNPSAFGTLKKSGIDSLKKLKGKTYAAMELPFEKEIINQAAANVNFVTPNKLDIYKLLFEKEADFVWLFKNIEVVEAKLNGIEFNLFTPQEAGVPYGPCTLLVSRQEFIADYSFLVKSFFDITSRAYLEIAADPDKTAAFLHQRGAEIFPDKELLIQTMRSSCEYYLTKKGKWGLMEEQQWDDFLDWLEEKGQIKKSYFNTNLLFSNRFLI
ncbi:MAG TPA: ABC transporter substrate-binding protein [Cytophagaceae bacterium]|nr:ABC transporter substrate-binding protein [Cytophagaceae bacterium]